ncbi:PDR/VanB family oxidoreductase [Marinomonas algarum]|uniref:PDR/VanB family oxidoreductase n=1 Tax=Marinomonas algarum TaxID=2883105 RepID=A0A9X1IP05_9GAMM|nr:PDR/VanB family oxidoreductase [Marinomonas algarum]MCB5162832.1 PDR/VanB family oxidoreductase [Marinomonas algarum]
MSSSQLKVKVAEIHRVAPTIREFTFIGMGCALPHFSPGSHTMVVMEGAGKTYRNAYSLLSDAANAHEYKIAVRLQDDSRGGSVFMHEQVKEGDELYITPPLNLFAPHWKAKKHLLLAGGVGITPFMSYLPEFLRQGVDVELHYLFRGKQTGAYQEELRHLLGDKLTTYDADKSQRCVLIELLKQQPLGTHIYICGPDKLVEGVEQAAKELGIPKSVIHSEAFASPKPGTPFQVEVKSSGQLVSVSEQDTMLEALETAGIAVPSLCRAGVCGQCLCMVEGGDIEHRDNYLSEKEKSSGKVIMPCVSRITNERIVIDL